MNDIVILYCYSKEKRLFELSDYKSLAIELAQPEEVMFYVNKYNIRLVIFEDMVYHVLENHFLIRKIINDLPHIIIGIYGSTQSLSSFIFSDNLIKIYDHQSDCDIGQLIHLAVNKSEYQYQISLMKETFSEELDKKNIVNKTDLVHYLKKNIISCLSHEIRTPLNGILGFLSLLTSDKLDNQKRRKYNYLVRQSADRLLDYLDCVSEYIMLDADYNSLKKNELSLNNLFFDLYVAFNEKAKQKNIELVVEKNPVLEKDFTVYTDSNKIYSILSRIVLSTLYNSSNGTITIGGKVHTNSGYFILTYEETNVYSNNNSLSCLIVSASLQNENLSDNFNFNDMELKIIIKYLELLKGRIEAYQNEDMLRISFVIPLERTEKHINNLVCIKNK